MKISNSIQAIPAMLLLIVSSFLYHTSADAQTVLVNPASPFVVPQGVTSIKVEVWGAGGGGGPVSISSSGGSGGGGGGGGAYRVATLSVNSNENYTITIGAGGTSGNNGGATTVSGPGGTVTANGGGAGGTGSFFGNGGAGAAGTGGTFNGAAGGASSGNGAGGGGAAGNNGSGTAGANNAAGTGGAGSPNNIPYIGGDGGAFITAAGPGSTGVTPGGGGGGARATGFGSNNGGTGAAGQVIITYTACPLPAAPTVTSPIHYCLNATASALTASGSNLLWYTVSSGGSGSSVAPVPSTTVAGTISYYVSQTVGCEGPRAQVDVIIHPLPVSTVNSRSDLTCFASNNGTITISGSGGTSPYSYSVDNGLTWSSPAASPYVYGGLQANTQYKIRVKDNVGCASKQVQ